VRAAKPFRLIFFGVLILLALVWIYPLFLVFINSFKPYSQIMYDFLGMPEALDFNRFTGVWQRLGLGGLFINTLVYTAFSVAGTLLLASMAAYKLSRTRGRISSFLFLLMLLPMLSPFQSYMITFTLFAKNLHMVGTGAGYIAAQIGLCLPLALFMFHGFVKNIPRELDEYALIDGASNFRTFFSIIFPLLMPILITVAVIDALAVWNDIVVNMLVIGGNSKLQNLQNALYVRFSAQQSDWETALPGMVMSMVPNIVFFLFMQRYIVSGITAGAIKS
jgi:raffinose/stachyose/melibiose transport system permease protein